MGIARCATCRVSACLAKTYRGSSNVNAAPASSQGEPQRVAVSKTLPVYWAGKYWQRLLLTSVVHARHQQDRVLIGAIQLVTHTHILTHSHSVLFVQYLETQ